MNHSDGSGSDILGIGRVGYFQFFFRVGSGCAGIVPTLKSAPADGLPAFSGIFCVFRNASSPNLVFFPGGY